jgi:ABC-type polysaccharide/polyol phosphate transport system ATPase subunit
MSEVVISVDTICKVYAVYKSLKDRLREILSVRGRVFHTDFYALKNVSFEVRAGDFLGIVGANGAGKSTLLKILSGLICQTSGSFTAYGRVMLLQLGGGFNAAMSGADNVSLALELHGYPKAVAEKKFQEIVEFSEIGNFIHQPVRTYSSGMYSRLAFSTAINAAPDILIVDEVLSVGDMRFTQKCLRKMRDFRDAGKTVIFVSHDITTINLFCDSAIWIRDGEIFMRGKTSEVTLEYQNFMLYGKLPTKPSSLIEEKSKESNELEEGADAIEENWISLAGLASIGDGRAVIDRVAQFLSGTTRAAYSVNGNEDVTISVEILGLETIYAPQVGFVIYNKYGVPAAHTNNDICGTPIRELEKGQRLKVEFHIRLPSLANGSYTVSLGIQTGMEMAHRVNEAYEFVVKRSDARSTQCGYSIIEVSNCRLSSVYP